MGYSMLGNCCNEHPHEARTQVQDQRDRTGPPGKPTALGYSDDGDNRWKMPAIKDPVEQLSTLSREIWTILSGYRKRQARG